MKQRKNSAIRIAFAILLSGIILGGCTQSGEQGGEPTKEPTASPVPTGMEAPSLTPSPEPTKEPENTPTPTLTEQQKSAVYDTTAGNIYTEITGDTALTVGVNIQEASTLDMIIFGDTASETAHKVSVKDPVRGEDLYGEQYVQMSSSANYITFEIDVDPRSFNYITVKFWGGDHGSNSAMILYNKDDINLSSQDYGNAWPLLDYLNSEPEQDGSYYYATYRLPITMTFNRETVKLELRHYGGVDAYDLNNDGIKYVDTENESRKIYRIISHTDPWYDRAEDEKTGIVPELEENTYYARSQSASAYDEIYAWLNETTETIISWQLYGDAFKTNVAAGLIPEMASGALLKGGKPTATYADMDAFATAYYNSVLSGNAENIKMMYGMALAYTLEGNAYYQSEELLERMCALWDFYVRAQGNNGGFGSDNVNWIGISDGTGSGYDEEGRQSGAKIIAAGEKSIAETFVMLYDAVEAAGLLEEKVDYNLDGILTEEETRRNAYYKMYYEGAIFGAEHAPRECVNQDLLNVTMLYHFQKAAALLGEAPYTEEYITQRLYAGLGITEHTYPLPDGTMYPHLGYQFSKKGALSLETFGHAAGGYCGNYGFGGASILYDFAHLTQDPVLIEQALKANDSLGYFLDYVMGADGVAVLRKEEVISTRNTFMPGRISFTGGGNNFLTVALGSESGKRMLELYLQSGYWKLALTSPSLLHADDLRHLADLVTVEGLKEYLQAAPAEADENGIVYHYDTGTDYVLPAEEGYGDFVWTDEMARCVVLRNGDDFLRMTLNWRMEYNGGRQFENADVNNVLRVHGFNSNEVYTATTYMKSPFEFEGVYLARYGDYTIVMNASPDKSYDITLVGSGKDCTTDLVTGEKVTFDEVITMAPYTTMVLYTNPDGPRTAREASEIVNPELIVVEEDWDETPLEEFGAGVYEIPAELDTFVKNNEASTSFSDLPNIVIGKEREAILLFDLRQIPEDAAKIVLRTYGHWGPGNELSFSIVENYQSVKPSVTYLTGVTYSEEVARYRINSASNAEAREDISLSPMTEIDITELVREYRTTHPTATRLCFYIMEPDVTNCTEIWSTENPHGIQYGPNLIVTVE